MLARGVGDTTVRCLVRAEYRRREEVAAAGCEQCGAPVVMMVSAYEPDLSEMVTFVCRGHAPVGMEFVDG